MGGCRCHFRQCHIGNARFPRMHFFRFPLKDPERYRKWRQYSKMEHMVNFSEIRRKNTAICSRHFRNECFMNYKMDRLVPSAVPTLMRLPNGQALDFELEIESGVLVTLEKPTSKHLISPDGFEDTLSLENDKILLKILNELQSQQYCTNVDISEGVDEYVDSTNTVEDLQITGIEKPVKNLVNSIEILETIQVTAPNLKRPREVDQNERPGTSNKKCRILNSTNYISDNKCITGESIIVASKTMQIENCELINGNDIDFIESDQIENTHELVENEGQLLLTREDVFINDVSEDGDDIEYFIHKDGNDFQYELPSSDSDTTIVQLKSDRQVYSDITQDLNQEIINLQSQLIELKKKNVDFETLQVKHAILESESNELKNICQQYEDENKKLLTLQIENNSFKNELKNYETLKDKLHKCCKENKKLQKETCNIDILNAELLSRKQETKELKKLLETLKSSQTDKQCLKKQFESNLENERSNFMANELKQKKEITDLKTKLSQIQKQLEIKETELKEVKTDFQCIKNENDRISQQNKELERSLNDIQHNFDLKQSDYRDLKSKYDCLHQKHSTIEQKYWKLQALQNQEPTVTTSLENKKQTCTQNSTQSITVNSLTKGQLFNGIKRYLSASMVPLLRMEMFGSLDREWKTDERQVAVDILRLGEMVYKYFTDEWRFRLPALRDAHNWLNQSQQIMDDEEDL